MNSSNFDIKDINDISKLVKQEGNFYLLNYKTLVTKFYRDNDLRYLELLYWNP